MSELKPQSCWSAWSPHAITATISTRQLATTHTEGAAVRPDQEQRAHALAPRRVCFDTRALAHRRAHDGHFARDVVRLRERVDALQDVLGRRRVAVE